MHCNASAHEHHQAETIRPEALAQETSRGFACFLLFYPTFMNGQRVCLDSCLAFVVERAASVRWLLLQCMRLSVVSRCPDHSGMRPSPG